MNAQFPLRAVLSASATGNPLPDRAMLSTLKVTQWTARKVDKGATNKVVADHGAHADAGRFNKALLAREALADIMSVTNEARAYHYSRTLPWLDDGARILPAAGYAEYSAGMRELRERFEAKVQAFEAGYAAFEADAARRLGTLYNPADYPPVAQIRSRFTFGTRVMPLPSASDFRADLSADAAAHIRREIEASSREALQAAMADAWGRVTDVVGRMVERLNAYRPATDIEKATGTFHASLVENVRDLCAVLPTFNLTGDPVLADICTRMAEQLCRHDAAKLREDDGARAETAAAAAAILADVSAYMA